METNRFYLYLNQLNLEKLTVEVPARLKTFLDPIYLNTQTEAVEKKNELQKISIAHALIQFCKNEGYLSPLLLAIELLQVSRSWFLEVVLHLFGISVSYSSMKYERYSSSKNLLLYPV